MGDALGWDARRRRKETKRGEEVLRGMDAGGRVEVGAPSAGVGWWAGDFRRRLCSVFGCPTPARLFSVAARYPRTLFESGEVEALREVFWQHARTPSSGSREQEQPRMPVSHLREAVRSIAGLGYAYDSVRESDFRYVLREAGLSESPEGEKSGNGKKRDELDFEEFVEVGLHSISSLCSRSCECWLVFFVLNL
jgi:glycerol-3-phosphate dehydrogenase